MLPSTAPIRTEGREWVDLLPYLTCRSSREGAALLSIFRASDAASQDTTNRSAKMPAKVPHLGMRKLLSPYPVSGMHHPLRLFRIRTHR